MKKTVKPISIDPNLYERIKEYCAKEGISYSKFMVECAELYLDIIEDNDALIRREMSRALESAKNAN